MFLIHCAMRTRCDIVTESHLLYYFIYIFHANVLVLEEDLYELITVVC